MNRSQIRQFSKVGMNLIFSLICIFLFSSQGHSAAAPQAQRDQHKLALEEWIRRERVLAYNYMRMNLSPQGTMPGTVVASPSRVHPDYWYHWVRDAALVMTVFFDFAHFSADPAVRKDSENLLAEYLKLEALHQRSQSPGGLGEPKYNVDGSPFTGPWGRPQNDGPALRAVVFIKMAKSLIARGQMESVKKYFYGSQQSLGVIKTDLVYVLKHWFEPSFDLWEEVKGQNFYTLMANRRALLDGAELASLLGQSQDSQVYVKAARRIENALSQHLDPRTNTVKENIHRVEGVWYKDTGLDVATVLSVLHSYRGDGYFSYQNDWLLSTIVAQEKTFKSVYPLNLAQAPLPMGVAFGRYPEDVYFGGNPWFLTTLAIAEHHYRLLVELQMQGRLVLNSLNFPFYSEYLTAPLSKSFKQRIIIDRNSQAFKTIMKSLIDKADLYLARVAYHAGRDGSLDEQFSKFNGYMLSARHLTWSYAAVTTAIQARDRAYWVLNRTQ